MSLVVVTGLTIPLQIAINKKLYEVVRSPVLATALTLSLGAILLGIVHLMGISGRGDLAAARGAPWWVWLGGVFVAFAITIQIINAKSEGGGPIVALIVAGQLASAMAVDHFGIMGMKQDPIRWWKILGALLMAGGAALLQIKANK